MIEEKNKITRLDIYPLNKRDPTKINSTMSSSSRDKPSPSPPPPPPPPPPKKWTLPLLLVLLFPVLMSMVMYKLVMEFDAADLPSDYPNRVIAVPNHNTNILKEIEWIGDGNLPGPEDLAYDSETKFIYTGCSDGWIKRFKTDCDKKLALEVENWSFVGGRPLGISFGPDRRLYVANAYKGLQVVEKDGTVKQLTDEADGVKFGLTDGVDVASNGVVYFTDASSKYSLDDYIFDFFEGRPYGKLLSFDPSTNLTTTLLKDLYFSNGVVISSDQNSVIFCETPMSRCRRYHIHGEKRGTVDDFIKNIPGFPDNIHYDGAGSYWIATPAARKGLFDFLLRYPLTRKMMAFLCKRFGLVSPLEDGGVLEVNFNGEPISLRTDGHLSSVTCGIKVENHLYIGSLEKGYVGRIKLHEKNIQDHA